ncbi:putative membrane protein [Bartonella vinsonii subsp. berkhoffii str. Winnie]|nr:putative membrane protein [Bartonella vinsonii subsp. berkhoffii str. Winnie]
MDHEELLICILAFTATSFFSLLTEIGKWSIQISSRLTNSCEPVVKSEYKSSFYKLWQYMIKSKPSICNESAVRFNNKKYIHIQQSSPSYSYSPEKLKQSENYTKILNLAPYRKQSSIENNLSFYKCNNYSVGSLNVCNFIPYVYMVCGMLACIKNVLRKNQICACKESFKLDNFTSRVNGNAVCQRLEKTHRIYVYINRVFYHQVCCL